MGNPDKAVTTEKQLGGFEEKVAEAVKTMTMNEETGVWDFPEDIKASFPEDVKVSAMHVKRHRDTQGALTKSQQSLKAIEAQNAALIEVLRSNSNSIQVTEAEQEELDTLMATNPQAWREKLNTYEQRSLEALDEKINATKEAATKVSIEEGRNLVLAQFNEENNAKITQDVLDFDVPPRFKNSLDNGEVTFEEYLTNVHTYLSTPKVAKDETVVKQPNLSNVGGGNTPSKASAGEDATTSYQNAVF